MINPEKVLITGGSGFFGKSLLDFLSARKCTAELTILTRQPDKLSAALPCIAPGLKTRVLAGDIIRKEWFDDYQLIIHAATLPANHPDIIEHTLLGCGNIAECAGLCGAKVLYLSSGAVYSESPSPLSEQSPTSPLTQYGKAKLEGENLLADRCSSLVIARCFAFIGKYMDMTMHYAATDFMRSALAGQPLRIKGDGETVRTYLSGEEWAEWCWQAGLNGEGIYNIGSPFPVTIRALAQETARLFQDSLDIIIENNPTAYGERRIYIPDISKITNQFNLSPVKSVKTMLKDLMNFQIKDQG